jgi:hypothetical protein
MIVGRAPNGWDPDQGFLYSDVSDIAEARNHIEKGISFTNSTKDPLAWVFEQAGVSDDYNTNKSAFWRVSRGVLEALCGETQEGRYWSSRLVWSNLYKISPASGGNPSGPLIEKQEGIATELLEQEISEYRPRAILFLTGRDWADPFLRTLPRCTLRDANEPIETMGTVTIEGEDVPFVVCPHPQGKAEEPIVTAAAAALRETD